MAEQSVVSMRMKIVWCVASGVVLLGAGCALFKPLNTPDSLDNASARTWAVTADFASGLHHTCEQTPDSFADFGTMTRDAVPVLTNLVVVSTSAPPVTYSLSSRELARLRRSTPGGLTLVLYDDGIACLSSALKQKLEQEVKRHPYTRENYFRLLRDQQAPALNWTRSTLARR